MVKEINEILNAMLNSESEAIIVKTPDELREILSNAKEEIRQFDHHTTWDDVSDMTFAEAISVLSRLANSDGRDWSARPHLVQACQAENGEYRCMYDIFKDLATVWDGICSMERLRLDVKALRKEKDNEADS